jgi:hypothetical protein
MQYFIKKISKKILPDFVWVELKKLKNKIQSILFFFIIKKLPRNHSKALNIAKHKDKIKVAFFLIHDSVWKYEGLYRLMENDKKFDPVVLICPYILGGSDNMLKEMNQAYESFKREGYQVIKSLKANGEWIDVKKEISPDLICFTNPWNLTQPEYLISNFIDTLTCYVPYGFKNSYLNESHYDKPMHNYTWKFFLETEIHQKLARIYARNKGVNTLVTGYPGMDIFLQKEYSPIDEWKLKDKKIRRIIWAPHHSITKGAILDYSTFLDYADFMLQLAEKYKNYIQIAFKPHPVLRPNLSKEEFWGKEKTDKYYYKWSQLQNGLLNEGKYIDLFLMSDGMIHDCSSFVIEYLYTNKPVMFLINNDSIPEKFNEIGKMALSQLYQGRNKKDIEYFIEEVILKGNDYKKDERINFFNSVVRPPNNLSASENIFNDLKSSIFDEPNNALNFNKD